MSLKLPSAQVASLFTGALLIFTIIAESNCENATVAQNFKTPTAPSQQQVSRYKPSSPREALESQNRGSPLSSLPSRGNMNNTRMSQERFRSSVHAKNITQSLSVSAGKSQGIPRVNFGRPSSGNVGSKTSFPGPAAPAPGPAERQKWRQRGKAPAQAQQDPNIGKEYLFWPLQVHYYPYKKGVKRVLGIPGEYKGDFDSSTFPYSAGTKYGALKSFQAQSYVPDLVPYILKSNRKKHFHAH